MILTIDTSGKEFVVTRAPERKYDQNGQARVDKETGEELWVTQLVCTDDDGGEIIKVNTSGEPEDLAVGDVVVISGLVALPWVSSGRSGVAFRASSIKAMD